MATQLPPPPVGAAQDSRAWTSWYSQLQVILTTASGLVWSLIDKTGSRLSDIQTRPHSDLTGILGTGPYHMTSNEATTVTNVNNNGHAGLTAIAGTGANHVSLDESRTLTTLNTDGRLSLKVKAGAPTTTDIAASQWALYKDSGTLAVKLWVNDGGTLKSVTLT